MILTKKNVLTFALFLATSVIYTFNFWMSLRFLMVMRSQGLKKPTDFTSIPGALSVEQITSNSADNLYVVGKEILLGSDQSSVRIGDDVRINSEQLKISLRNGNVITLAAKEVLERVKDDPFKGTKVSDLLSVSNIRASASNDLLVTAPSGRLNLHGPKGVVLNSFAGSLNMTSSTEATLKGKKISLRSNAVFLTGLQPARRNGKTEEDAYQLCACANGNIFITEPSAVCAADYHVCHETSQ